MKWTNLALPIAAITILTGGCGPTDKKASQKSTAGAPVLTRVWQVPRTVAKLDGPAPDDALLVGSTVVAHDPKKRSRLVFIDGATGRVTGRVSGAPKGIQADLDVDVDVDAVSDERGRPLVALSGTNVQKVYDTTGRLVWQSREPVAQYVGGYVIEAKPSGDTTSRVVIHKPHGPVVASWTSFARDPDSPADVFRHVESIRPGWLVVTRGRSADATETVLLDLTHPGKAREKVLRPPTKNYGPLPKVSVAEKHVYVSWILASEKPIPIARYDLPSTKPVWQRRAPGSQVGFPAEVAAYTDPKGPEIVVASNTDTFWYLRPDTGAMLGPRAGIRKFSSVFDVILGASGGRVFLGTENSTKIVDPRTGAVLRTINGRSLGVTTNGYLIRYVSNTISAYRLKY